jgi:hypothetical protein
MQTFSAQNSRLFVSSNGDGVYFFSFCLVDFFFFFIFAFPQDVKEHGMTGDLSELVTEELLSLTEGAWFYSDYDMLSARDPVPSQVYRFLCIFFFFFFFFV